MRLLLLAAAGGALGSAARYATYIGFARAGWERFPWATLTVNLAGSFLIGALIAAFAKAWPGAEGPRIFLTTGVLGGFTTFSAFSLDVMVLIERNEPGIALLYILLSVLISVAACWVGLTLVRTLLA